MTRDPERRRMSFLTAEWRHLLMLNYAIDPSVLRDRVPAGCELDDWNGTTFVSVVGFRFLRTRVIGVPIPFHCNFEEVNLRFYVRRKVGGAWRRGVVFVRELVPRWAIAFVARQTYGEKYLSLPMRHSLVVTPTTSRLGYEWQRDGRWERVSASYGGAPFVPGDDDEATFITEHYWGYASQPKGGTVEYRVEHPRWRVWAASDAELDCDIAGLYGDAFVESLSADVTSTFVAEGSAVTVRWGERIAKGGAVV